MKIITKSEERDEREEKEEREEKQKLENQKQSFIFRLRASVL